MSFKVRVREGESLGGEMTMLRAGAGLKFGDESIMELRMIKEFGRTRQVWSTEQELRERAMACHARVH